MERPEKQVSSHLTVMSNEKTKEADREFLLTRMHYYNRHPNKNQRDMDIFPIFTSPRATKIVIDDFVAYIRANYDVHKEVGVIVGPEAEGFLFGPLVAMQLGLPFAPARKQRKLPGDIVRERYAKWSSTDALEMQICAFDDVDIAKGAIIVDDSVASGGSAGGVKRCIERLGMKVLCGVFVYVADMPEHRKTQRENLGDLELYGIVPVSEETLKGMEVRDGKKDEAGEYIGDAGGSNTEPKKFEDW